MTKGKSARAEEARLLLDREGNVLTYESAAGRGLMVNISSHSLTRLYQDYGDRGLFDLNVRRYVRNKLVDDGIRHTLEQERDNFWFYNNGVIITCSGCVLEGREAVIRDFSIVNGGQTTTIIGRYRGKNKEEFFIPCRIVVADAADSADFFARVAAATAAQKPVRHSDLYSNHQRLRRLQQSLAQEGVYLELKRGEAMPASCGEKIKKEELAKLILCVALQRPGTARINSGAVFAQPLVFDLVFRGDYQGEGDATGFLRDLARLNWAYGLAEKDLLLRGTNALEKEVLRQGRQALLSLLGVVYSLVNNDVRPADAPAAISSFPFVYAPLFERCGPEQLPARLKDLLSLTLAQAVDSYTRWEAKGKVSSPAAFLRSDKCYQELLIPDFAVAWERRPGIELRRAGEIFRRD